MHRLLSRVDEDMLIALTSPYSGETRKKCNFEKHSLILDCWTDVHEWMAVLARGPSKVVVFWDLVYLPGGTAQDICEAVFALYERDCVDAQRLCSWTSDGRRS